MGDYVFVYHEAKIYAFGGSDSNSKAEELNELLEKYNMPPINHFQLGYGESFNRSDYKRVDNIWDIRAKVMKRISNIK